MGCARKCVYLIMYCIRTCLKNNVVQSLSHVRLFETQWTVAHQASLSSTISLSLLKLKFIESVMPSNHLILCHPLLLPLILPRIKVFSNKSAFRIRWPKYWSFSISPSNEYSGFIFFRIDWFDLLAVQGTLKSQKSNIIFCLQFHYTNVLDSLFTDYWLSTGFVLLYCYLPYMLINIGLAPKFIQVFLFCKEKPKGNYWVGHSSFLVNFCI